MDHGRRFFETYIPRGDGLTIVDVGAQDVFGSLRSVAPAGAKYIGVDFEAGKGVDVVISDPYSLPFDDASVDAVVSSSCYEHSEFFWLTYLESLRILRPQGLLYLNVPSNGYFHRYPIDCWRFYPDSGLALQNWARFNAKDVLLLESFIGKQLTGVWNDFVAVFLRSTEHADLYPDRMLAKTNDYTNGLVAGSTEFSNFARVPEDQNGWCAHARRLVRDWVLGGLK